MFQCMSRILRLEQARAAKFTSCAAKVSLSDCHVYRVRHKKYSLNCLRFSEQPLGILSPNFTYLLRVYSLVKMPKTCYYLQLRQNYWIFRENHIVISHVHMQRNVCKTNGAPCLRLIHYYSINVTNYLAVTLRTWHVHCRLSHMHLFLVKFLTTLLMASWPRPRSLAVYACMSLATNFSFSEKLSMNTIAN